MLNLEEINNTIADLENGDTTFATCEKLAYLYIVRDHITKSMDVDHVQTELNDILPQYQLYKEVKRKYQLNELTESAVDLAIRDVCKEIREFIDILYSGTDMQTERAQIVAMISMLHEKFVKVA